VSGALLGTPAGEIRAGPARGSRVRAPTRCATTRCDWRAADRRERHGRVTPLGSLATSHRHNQDQLERENQQQMIAMTADVSGRSLGGDG